MKPDPIVEEGWILHCRPRAQIAFEANRKPVKRGNTVATPLVAAAASRTKSFEIPIALVKAYSAADLQRQRAILQYRTD